MAAVQKGAEGSKVRGRKVPKLSEPEEWLPIEEIQLRYPDEWVLVKVDAPDKPERAMKGVVLAHGPSLKRISGASIRAHREEPGICTSVFRGGKRPKTREEREAVIANAAGLGIFGPGWR